MEVDGEDGMKGKEKKKRAFKPHYMLAGKPQADVTYVDLRTHTTANQCNRKAEKQVEACGKWKGKERERERASYGGEISGSSKMTRVVIKLLFVRQLRPANVKEAFQSHTHTKQRLQRCHYGSLELEANLFPSVVMLYCWKGGEIDGASEANRDPLSPSHS